MMPIFVAKFALSESFIVQLSHEANNSTDGLLRTGIIAALRFLRHRRLTNALQNLTSTL
jgi:hypothetical protein